MWESQIKIKVILDTRFRLVSLSTKSIGNIESRLHRQDLRHCQSAQGREYLDNEFSCVESKIYGKNTCRTQTVYYNYSPYITYSKYIYTILVIIWWIFIAFRGRFSDNSGTTAASWRKQSFAMEHVESQCTNLHICRPHRCCARISMATSEIRYYNWNVY